MAGNLLNQQGRFRMKRFAILNDDEALLKEIRLV